MDNSFKHHFEKTALLGSLLGFGVAASAEKRIAEKSFQYSKQKALGLPVKDSGFLAFVDKDIDRVKAMKPGMLKKVRTFLMNEGPLIAAYSPAQQGKALGANLRAAAEIIPGDSRVFLDQLTHPDPLVSGKAMKSFAETIKKIHTGKKIALYGGLGLLGALVGRAVLKAGEGPESHP